MSKNPTVPILSAIAAIGTVLALYLVFVHDAGAHQGVDYLIDPDSGRLVQTSLFFSQRIFFFHVPFAFVLDTAVGVAGITSILFLWKHDPRMDDIAASATEIAVAFGAGVLATGMIWAKAAWGVWWQWEPRLTMSLLLWLILVGYVLVRKFAGPSADRVAAGMAIFGMVGVPFIYVMVGQDSHPGSGSNGTVATLSPAILPAFWLAVATLMTWFVALVIVRVQATRAERELRELRERALDLGVVE
ncbi:MAG: cytochrome c biogenesis protein CcsA [Kofleriaceae bacterium]